MSPRRSSRARMSQPAPNPPIHTNSSTSLTSQSRVERNNRSTNTQQSSGTSSNQRSMSLDEADSKDATEGLAPRRSRRGNEPEKEEKSNQPGPEEDDEALEEEVTRCICGHTDYLGPPASIREYGLPLSGRASSKDDNKRTEDPTVLDELSEDVGNFFIQCDKCHVWQHGGCVGLTDESMSPDNYYCEECRPDYHKIIKSSDGTKSSRYLPVLEALTSRSSSLSSQAKSSKKDSKGKLTEKELSTRRRATMNSRTAYDEDEMLRRAIEESKEMGTLGKRSRDESEDLKLNSKRQRTSSNSPSTLSNQSQSPSGELGSEQLSSRPSANGQTNSKKIGGAAARNHRDKESRERPNERDAKRAEAANKRAARSERRRADESPPPTPGISPSKQGEKPTSTKEKSGTSNPSPANRLNAVNHRKTGRPPARRGRLGRNQYTRDLPLDGEGSPSRDRSNEVNGTSRSPPNANGINGESGRSSKPKYHNPTRTSMNEMKRRVAAILEFVNRMQTDKTSQNSSASASEKGSKAAATPNGVSSASTASAGPSSSALLQAVKAGLSPSTNGGAVRNFNEMPSSDMMETLGQELLHWQTLYGKYGEK